MTNYTSPYLSRYNIKDRWTVQRQRRDPALDPTNFGWSKPTIGKAEYFLDLDWIKYRMIFDYAYDFKVCDWARVWVVYPILVATGEAIGQPIVYNVGCDLDAVTDVLIDYAGNVGDLLTAVWFQQEEINKL